MKRFDTILVIRATIIANDEQEAAQLGKECMMDPPVHLMGSEVLDITLVNNPEVIDGQEEEKEEIQVATVRHVRRDR